jgi:hypothetical protein
LQPSDVTKGRATACSRSPHCSISDEQHSAADGCGEEVLSFTSFLSSCPQVDASCAVLRFLQSSTSPDGLTYPASRMSLYV